MTKNLQSEALPPIAKKEPHQFTLHDNVHTDNYHWIRTQKNPDALDYIKLENSYTNYIMNDSQKLQDKIFEELKSRKEEESQSDPFLMNGYYYYRKFEKGNEYPIYFRFPENVDIGKAKIILDIQKLSKGLDYCYVSEFKVSRDNKLLAYTLDNNGSEEYLVYIIDINSGEIIDKITKNISEIEWANDNQTLFYTVQDDTNRPYKVYRYNIVNKTHKSIYTEKNLSYYVSIKKTKDHSLLIVEIESQITSESRYLYANKPKSKLKLFLKRKEGVEYSIFKHLNDIYILTNENAKNFKIIKTNLDNKNRHVFLDHDVDKRIFYIDTFKNYLAVFFRQNGLPMIKVFNFDNQAFHTISMPDDNYSISMGSNKEFSSSKLRFKYSSLITPQTDFDYDMKSKKLRMINQIEIPSGYDKGKYKTKRVFATSHDNIKVPISLMYRKDLVLDGTAPLLLTGYGSYGSNYDAYFSTNRISLVDRGFVYGIAHIRGGGEMGREWYENGKLLSKKNTFYDFISCSEYLINNKYTSSEHLIIEGGSAGGLLIGAVLNMRPELFKGAIADVPFVDVINTMIDSTIPLTVTEYDEWGNPDNKQFYDYMKSYSPYDNVKKTNYPNILTVSGINDPRVMYWEPTKWVAKLRDMKTDNNLLLLKMDMGTGHGGASGRYDFLKNIAFEYAFMMKILNMRDEK